MNMKEHCPKKYYKQYGFQSFPPCSFTMTAANKTQARKLNKYKQKMLLGLLLPLIKHFRSTGERHITSPWQKIFLKTLKKKK